MQSGVTVVAMFNQLMNIFKTSDVLYNGTNLDDHLFSTYLTNDKFMRQTYSQKMSYLVGMDSLKSFNFAELFANVFYFFDAPNPIEGQYRLQKLVYGLLYRDGERLTPLMEFAVHGAIDVVLGKYS